MSARKIRPKQPVKRSSRTQRPGCGEGVGAAVRGCLSFHREAFSFCEKTYAMPGPSGRNNLIPASSHFLLWFFPVLCSPGRCQVPPRRGACSLHPVPTPQALGLTNRSLCCPEPPAWRQGQALQPPSLEAGGDPGAHSLEAGGGPGAHSLEAGAGPGAQSPTNLKLLSYILTLFVHGYQPCYY